MNKKIIIIFFTFFVGVQVHSQEQSKIKRAALDYLEGFYEGDTLKIKRSIHPDLSKYGFSKDRKTKAYKKGRTMTYKKAIGFAIDVLEDPQWAAPKGAVKKVEILDIQDKIANVKVTAYWGIDYLLLVKEKGKWMILKVLWQSTKK